MMDDIQHLAGQVSAGAVGSSKNFEAWAIVPGIATLAESQARAADSLRRLAAQVAASES